MASLRHPHSLQCSHADGETEIRREEAPDLAGCERAPQTQDPFSPGLDRRSRQRPQHWRLLGPPCTVLVMQDLDHTVKTLSFKEFACKLPFGIGPMCLPPALEPGLSGSRFWGSREAGPGTRAPTPGCGSRGSGPLARAPAPRPAPRPRLRPRWRPPSGPGCGGGRRSRKSGRGRRRRRRRRAGPARLKPLEGVGRPGGGWKGRAARRQRAQRSEAAETRAEPKFARSP